jgi:hypothetical protein
VSPVCYRLRLNHLKRSQRREAIEKNLNDLGRRVRELNPKHIIPIKKSIFEPVKRLLTTIGYGERVVGEKGLPFPSHHHQRSFVIRLREMLESIDENTLQS